MKISASRHEASDSTTITYPWAGMYSDHEGSFVVLFETYSQGVVIQSDHPARKVGASSDAWSTYKYKPFYGSINLSFSP